MTVARSLILQSLRYLPFVALLFLALQTRAQDVTPGVPVEKVNAYRDGDVFMTELQTKGPWIGGDINAQFTADSIQIDLPGAVLTKGKQLIKVDDRNFKSVYATQNESSVRTRFTLNGGLNASSLQDQVRVRRAGSAIVIEVTGDAKTTAKSAKIGDVIKTIAIVDDENGESISAKLVAGAPAKAANDVVEATVASTDISTAAAKVEMKPDTNKLPESQIPVLASQKEAKKSSSSPIGRLLLTLGILAVVLGATVFGVKRYAAARNLGPKSSTKIRVLTQHPLGPKKSLAIIQVAGESILVGITDQNISMLKTLSLIDDEVPTEVPNRFEAALDEFEEEAPRARRSRSYENEDDEFASQDLTKIRDVVSTRLKNMRNI
ncbi:MAG: flagellar biosynthetic protein FliO [Bdellovibrionota bacterium]